MDANALANLALVTTLPMFVGYAADIRWLRLGSTLLLAALLVAAKGLMDGMVGAVFMLMFFAALPALPPLLTLPLQWAALRKAEFIYGTSGVSLRPSISEAYKTFWE